MDDISSNNRHTAKVFLLVLISVASFILFYTKICLVRFSLGPIGAYWAGKSTLDFPVIIFHERSRLLGPIFLFHLRLLGLGAQQTSIFFNSVYLLLIYRSFMTFFC